MRHRAHHNRSYDLASWKRFRARRLADHRRQFGEWCPGDLPEHPAHAVIPPDFLTLDHVEGVQSGLFSPTRVLCGRWNSVLGGRAAHR